MIGLSSSYGSDNVTLQHNSYSSLVTHTLEGLSATETTF